MPVYPGALRVARHPPGIRNQPAPGREHGRLMTPTVEIQRHAVADPRRADLREEISNGAAQTDLHPSLA
jgi:hypothetical protein